MGIPIGTKVSRSGNLLYTPVLYLAAACAGMFAFGAAVPAWSDVAFGADVRRPWVSKMTIEEAELAARIMALEHGRARKGDLGPEAQARVAQADAEALERLRAHVKADSDVEEQVRLTEKMRQTLRNDPELAAKYMAAQKAARETHNPFFNPAISQRPL